MKYLYCILLLVAVVMAAGCTIGEQKPVATPTPKIVYVTVLVTPSPTPIPAKIVTTTIVTTKIVTPKTGTAKTRAPILTSTPTTAPIIFHNITEGFWCRDTTLNIGKDPTDVRECYQFFEDGTYTWGYTPGKPMGKSASCSGDPSAKCHYSLGPTGKYEIEGGYFFIISGDAIVDPHDPPHFTWTETGIP